MCCVSGAALSFLSYHYSRVIDSRAAHGDAEGVEEGPARHHGLPSARFERGAAVHADGGQQQGEGRNDGHTAESHAFVL